MIRFGLCCKFEKEPIKFYTTTATFLMKLKKKDALRKLSDLCLKNAQSLERALIYCAENKIGCFRVNSQILPLKTHPQAGYEVQDLPDGDDIINTFKQCKTLLNKHKLRTTFHPDQFILLSSPSDDVNRRSIADLKYQAQVSQWIGADAINIHGGGGYGDKEAALGRLACNLKKLPKAVRSLLTLENDDRTYTPQDLLPFCEKHKIPFVYDVHHHRCLPDNLSVEEATQRAIKTWDREPIFHLSSSREGWTSRTPQYHHDYININDFPECWRNLNVTIEVEAKAKELAVKKLLKQLLKKKYN